MIRTMQIVCLILLSFMSTAQVIIDWLEIKTQAELDSFAQSYGHIDKINSLVLSGCDITSLNKLPVIDSLGSLRMRGTTLNDFTPFNKIKKIYGISFRDFKGDSINIDYNYLTGFSFHSSLTKPYFISLKSDSLIELRFEVTRRGSVTADIQVPHVEYFHTIGNVNINANPKVSVPYYRQGSNNNYRSIAEVGNFCDLKSIQEIMVTYGANLYGERQRYFSTDGIEELDPPKIKAMNLEVDSLDFGHSRPTSPVVLDVLQLYKIKQFINTDNWDQIMMKILFVTACPMLQSFEGADLSSLESFVCIDNPVLSDISAINMTQGLKNNPILLSNGIAGIVQHPLTLRGNPNLEICTYKPICDYVRDFDYYTISNNKLACDNPVSLKEACRPLQSEETTFKDLSIYPNPITSQLFINGLNTSANYKIIDINGFVKLRGLYTEGLGINISELHNGVYLLKVTESNGFKEYLFKIVKI